MALTEQELQIVQFGQQGGKSRDEILRAVDKHRGTTLATESLKRAEKPGVVRETLGDIGGIATGIGEQLGRAKEKIGEAAAGTRAGEQGFVRGLFQTVGAAAGGVAGILGEVSIGAAKAVLPQGAEDAIKRQVEKIVGSAIETEPAQKLIAGFERLEQDNPALARDLQSALGFGELATSVLGVGAGAAGTRQVIKTGRGLVKRGVSAAERAKTKVTEAVKRVKVPELAPKGTTLEQATKIIAPKVTVKTEAEALRRGLVKQEGILGKVEIKPGAKELQIAETVEPLVRAGKVKAGAKPEVNIAGISEEVSRINKGVGDFIRANKAPFSAKQLRSRLDKGINELRLIFASEPTAQRTFDAVVKEFMSNVGKKDTLGLFEARQTFDKIPAIKKLLQSEGLGENARKEIVLTVRRSANEFIADLLPADNKFKANLLTEHRLIDAIQNIAEASTGRVGKNAIQIFFKEHPTLRRFLPFLVGGVATGTILQ